MSALFECRARRGDLGGYNQLITIGLVSPGVGPHRPVELSSLGIRRLRRGGWRARLPLPGPVRNAILGRENAGIWRMSVNNFYGCGASLNWDGYCNPEVDQ